ncbi:MAG: hypothetical protein C0486_05175 [Erythrobacter sp.]|nr:hypothetical protein [Erythrobacter sp.]MBA4079936.1 hypothetical protein [Erythrobacter sp.]
MRKTIAGLMIGVLSLGSAAGAVAATAVPFAPVKPAEFGQLNNRAVLGLAVAQAEDCTPDSAGNGCPAGGEEGGFLGGNALPVIAGVGVVGVAIAVAAGGGSSSP